MADADNSAGKPASVGNQVSPEIGRVTAERTFAVANVSPATEPLAEVPYHQAVVQFLGGDIESCSCYHGRLVKGVRSHPLIGAVHHAFATHRPLCLSPDIIWLTLTQGLAQHINANAEQLRHHFVEHQGKVQIVVRRDDFVKGSPENPWPEVFAQFSDAIRGHIGAAHDLIVADFSTTGPVERAASELVLLDTMQAYFSYKLVTVCGMPSITLQGTVEDWQSIGKRVQAFARYDLNWWVAGLEPILEQFVRAAAGTVDGAFWDSMYKWHGRQGSGTSPYVSGWIVKLFPYLNPGGESFYAGETRDTPSLCRNPWIDTQPSRDHGPGPSRFPSLPARAPFLWEYLGRNYEMEFIGGLIGVRQDPQTLCLQPEIGWAVWEAGTEKRKATAEAEAVELEQLRLEAEYARAAERGRRKG
jgi:hypothetical protein